ncbi:hypothetical protein EC973_005395 [Apophysomyces ossiformis]|uniref:Kelch repeat protein n=1 Tax=Apophysomyces ossiformis TaxID=679940 RepID=A0A8H7BDY8_9FUNG|nr:hypothetical protein EC973_005395 [Apophysomyces ossiformis]
MTFTCHPLIGRLSRKHHTTTLLPDGSFYVLGGLDLNTDSLASPASFRIDGNGITHPTNHSTLPRYGHTTHYHPPSRTLVSLFGQPHVSHFNHTVPSRHAHTSAVVGKDFYVWGGFDEQHQPLNDIWKLAWPGDSWTRLGMTKPRGGHTMVQYHQWLLTCFGAISNSTDDLCTVFDTITLTTHHPTHSFYGTGSPTPRVHATMNQFNQTAIVFGGQTDNGKLLDDAWQIDLSHLPDHLEWKPIGRAPAVRSGHAGVFVRDTTLMFHGGVDGTSARAIDSLFLDVQTMTWLQPCVPKMFAVDDQGNNNQLRAEEVPTTATNTLAGGAIAGIVVAVVGSMVLAFGLLLVWTRRRRRQREEHRRSRNPRFSSIPRTLADNRPISKNNIALSLDRQAAASMTAIQQAKQSSPYPSPQSNPAMDVQAPAIELTPAPAPTTDTSATSHQCSQDQSPVSSPSRPPSENTLWMQAVLNNLGDGLTKTDTLPPRNGSTTTLTPTTPTFPQRTASVVSSKSVASIQWVGFNDQMDSDWREQHLASNKSYGHSSSSRGPTTTT